MTKNKIRELNGLIIIMFLPIVISTGIFFTTIITMTSVSQATAQETDVTTNTGGEKIIQQGIATSSPDPLPGHQAHQSITILRLRDDNSVFSGRITFTTTQPVEVQILHRDMTIAGPGHSPVIPEKFGKLAILDLPGGNGQITITNVVPKFTEGATGSTFAASVPFSGNAVALHNLEGKPFAATYTATADVLGPATRADDIAPEEQETNLEQQSDEQASSPEKQ
jgi:hypothetical protein